MVQTLYKDFQCSVIVDSETTDWFPVITGVKQGCCMSGFLFLLIIDWVMRQTVEGERTGIRWKFTTMLEDLDFADDIALLSSTMNHLQHKTATLEDDAAKVGLKLNGQKCKTMKVNSRSDDRLRVGGQEVEEVESFTYLGANGGGTTDVKKREALAIAQMKRLSNIWQAGHIGRKTKASLFKTLVISVLLYGCETWKMTKGEEEKLDIFQTKCLMRLLPSGGQLKAEGREGARKQLGDEWWRWNGKEQAGTR